MYYQRRARLKSFGDILKRITRPLKRQYASLALLQEAWSASAGSALAQRTRVAKLTNSTLTVYVDSAVTAHEIEGFLKEEILHKLRRALPERHIERLKCVPINPGAVTNTEQ